MSDPDVAGPEEASTDTLGQPMDHSQQLNFTSQRIDRTDLHPPPSAAAPSSPSLFQQIHLNARPTPSESFPINSGSSRSSPLPQTHISLTPTLPTMLPPDRHISAFTPQIPHAAVPIASDDDDNLPDSSDEADSDRDDDSFTEEKEEWSEVDEEDVVDDQAIPSRRAARLERAMTHVLHHAPLSLLQSLREAGLVDDLLINQHIHRLEQLAADDVLVHCATTPVYPRVALDHHVAYLPVGGALMSSLSRPGEMGLSLRLRPTPITPELLQSVINDVEQDSEGEYDSDEVADADGPDDGRRFNERFAVTMMSGRLRWLEAAREDVDMESAGRGGGSE